jgi:hypothetical protein
MNVGEFLMPYGVKGDLPKRDIIECLIMVGGIVETYKNEAGGSRNKYLPVCSNPNDQFSETMW